MASTGLSESTDESPPPSTFRGAPPVRQRVADHVFDSLARAILSGELRPEQPLATQRDLAKQFSVSALVVRQAIHRLEDLGLVRVRQGSATIVLDPNESTDIRLIQLRMELAEPGPALSTAAIENQTLFLIPILMLAERRITDQEIGVLTYLIDTMKDKPAPADVRRFRIEWWRLISKATRNALFQQQIRWWSTLVGELDQRGMKMRAPAGAFNADFYRKLLHALSEHKGAVELFTESVIKPLLDWSDAERAKIKTPARDR
jgi:DNA-binding FadR family transcriptional regulator